MEDFVALDLETANSDYASICEIGLVRFSNGIPVDSLSSFVSLPDELDYFENTWIHGITEQDCLTRCDITYSVYRCDDCGARSTKGTIRK
jgi:DNA polymerase III epsilon subunit-like protein